MFEFRLPDVGEGIQEGEVVKWHVHEGDHVKSDQLLAEIETDKAVVEITSPRAGVIGKIMHAEGETVKVGEVMVMIVDEGEQMVKIAPVSESDHYTSSVVGQIDEADKVVEHREIQQTRVTSTVKATPAVRKMAKDSGINIEKIRGTGKDGMVTEEDVRNFSKGAAVVEEATTVTQGAEPDVTQGAADTEQPVFSESGEAVEGVHQVKKFDFYGYIEHVPFRGIRKATAAHLSQSWAKAVHVTHMDEADVTKLWELREEEKEPAKEKGAKLTFMPFIVKAAIAALAEHPTLNATLDEEHAEIIVKKYYNIGVAVDTPDGLVVPVVKEANNIGLLALAIEIERLAKTAAERKLDIADFKGGTFTITNVGALGGTHATPIINYPEAAILAVGRIYDKIVLRDGNIVPRKYLPFSVTFDHRVLDGAECARFANKLKEQLENANFTVE